MKELHIWFKQNRRDLPWRENPNPYKVWISEVMLQQTRASVVVGYFHRFIQAFPDVVALASAPIEAVIKIWEGLGYYSRARNLHKGAQQIVANFAGRFPDNRNDLETIQGLGPYTVGAILSFAFRKRAAAVDGNVTRVLSRYLLIEENITKQSTKRKIFDEAERILDEKEPWVTAEALIELGAMICTPKPHCSECPLQMGCQAFKENKADSLPIKQAEKRITDLYRAVVLIEADGKILVKKGEPGRIMADLYEFPYFEMGEIWPQRKVVEAVEKELGLQSEILGKKSMITHTFTRYRAHLYPLRLKTKQTAPIPGYIWVEREILSELPFSSGHRKLI